MNTKEINSKILQMIRYDVGHPINSLGGSNLNTNHFVCTDDWYKVFNSVADIIQPSFTNIAGCTLRTLWEK
jgi:hypothetical protein